MVFRWGLPSILLLALAHGLFYVVTIPPWDLFDEGTHLAYVLTLRDERRVPHIEEFHRQDIIDSEIATERWDAFRIGRPSGATPEEMGLGGRIYQGYQPPLYYLLVLPATLVNRDDVLTGMYLARLLGPILLVALVAITWFQSRLWFPDLRPGAHLAPAAMVALVPSAAEAAGRVNNDLLAAVLIAGGVLAASKFVRNPGWQSATMLGLVSAAAILTKSHGLLLLPLILVAVLIVLRRRSRQPWIAVLAVLPPLAALGGWSLWIHARYGVWSGTEAFLAFARPFEPLSVAAFLEAVWLTAWSSYWAAYGGGWLQWLTGFVLAALMVGGLIGLRRVALNISWALFSAVLLVGTLVVLWYGNASGLVHPHGRILVPVFPTLAVLSATGWTGLSHDRGALVPVVTLAGLSIGFLLGWYLPWFYWD